MRFVILATTFNRSDEEGEWSVTELRIGNFSIELKKRYKSYET